VKETSFLLKTGHLAYFGAYDICVGIFQG